MLQLRRGWGPCMPSPAYERWNRKRSPGTVAYYVYKITFRSQDIPDAIFRHHAMAGFPRTAREIWVWKRASRNLLLKIDPLARWEKHEARKCPRCGRWMLGIQAQMQRERDMVARMKGEKVRPCNSGACV